MRKIIFVFLMTAFQGAMAEESLCTNDEAIVFSCHADKKIISLCRPTAEAHSLVYRYGTQGHIELAYPDRRKKNARTFHTSTAPLYGGGITIVAFRRGSHEYRVFSKVGRDEGSNKSERNTPVFVDGLTVSRDGKPLSEKICDDGGAGFREDLDWLPQR